MSGIHISLSPNTEPDDVRLAAAMLMQPWRWSDPTPVEQVERELAAAFPGSAGAVLASSGRTALSAALRAAQIGSGDEVIIQAFTCLAVPAAVKATGAQPVFADIDQHTFNLDPVSVGKCITQKTKAIIVQHTFGIPGPLDELRALAQQHSLLLIEDLAHSLGGTWHGKPLGTIGDIAVLSFGRDKMLSSVFGGAVVSRHTDILAAVRAQQATLPLPPAWWTIQQLLHPILLSVIVPLYFAGGLGKALLVAAQRARLLSKAVGANERRGDTPRLAGWRISSALVVLLANQWTKRERYLTRRREITKQYATALDTKDISPELLETAAWLRFPLLVKDPAAVRRKALQQQIFLGDWYMTPVAPCTLGQINVTGYQPGSCPVAETISEHIVNLPTYPRLTDKDVERVIHFIRENRHVTA